MKLFEEFIKETNQKMDPMEYVRDMAAEDYEVGHPQDPDDYEEFASILQSDGIEPSEELFSYYFECFDEMKEQN